MFTLNLSHPSKATPPGCSWPHTLSGRESATVIQGECEAGSSLDRLRIRHRPLLPPQDLTPTMPYQSSIPSLPKENGAMTSTPTSIYLYKNILLILCLCEFVHDHKIFTALYKPGFGRNTVLYQLAGHAKH